MWVLEIHRYTKTPHLLDLKFYQIRDKAETDRSPSAGSGEDGLPQN